MDNDYTLWVQKAFVQANEHPSISSVTKPETINGMYYFTAIFQVSLPGKYDSIGQTPFGVRKEEPVTFRFPKDYPIKAPILVLRDDFSRNHPHINPSSEEVLPCVFFGSLSDLMHHSKGFGEILDQMIDWLEKASVGDLINSPIGWEPMRMDELQGRLVYAKEEIRDMYADSYTCRSGNIAYHYIEKTKFLAARVLPLSDYLLDKNETKSTILSFVTEANKICDKYISTQISTFEDLCSLADKCFIKDFRLYVNQKIKGQSLEYLFITLAVRRPKNIIGDISDLELLNFAIKVNLIAKSGNIHRKSIVLPLIHVDECNPKLLQKFSGIQANNKLGIVQMGCGSLGSKISLHLARNGNNNFTLIDKDIMLPHNNARHALAANKLYINKALMLGIYIEQMGIQTREYGNEIHEIVESISTSSLFIDSTASLSVRSYLARAKINGIVVHTALYQHGKVALLLCEGRNRNPRIDDLVATLYSYCLKNDVLHNALFNAQHDFEYIGQGCGSYTTKATDAKISLSAAGMVARIQSYISEGTPDHGEIYIGIVDQNDMGIQWEKEILEEVFVIESDEDDQGYEIRLLPNVVTEMDRIAKLHAPNEFGGGLIGHISETNRTIIVTDLIAAPEDSVASPNAFVLGTKGLTKAVQNIIVKTSGQLTYLGTWHSHPMGGGASKTDISTMTKLSTVRDFEATVCLIWRPDGITKIR